MRSRPSLGVGGNRLPELHWLIIKTMVSICHCWRRRGFGKACRALGKCLFGEGNYVDVEVEPHGVALRLYLFDGYWNYFLFPDYRYEPEIQRLLFRQANVPGVNFLDCGANIGYWPLVVHKQFGSASSIVAVEASPAQFARLQENLQLNHADVIGLNAAIWYRDGEGLLFATDRYHHASGRIVSEQLAVQKGKKRLGQTFHVPTVTIDSIVRQHFTKGSPLVIKLDLEGAELAALAGAEATLRDYDPLVIYEDHGNDYDCSISAHLLDAGFAIFSYVHDVPYRINEIAEVRKTKVNSHQGYNFFACAPDSAFLSMIEI